MERLLVGVLEEHRERAVSAHTVSEDARFVGDHGEVGVNEFRKLQSINTISTNHQATVLEIQKIINK